MNELIGLMKAHTNNGTSDYCLIEYRKRTDKLYAHMGGNVYKYEKGEWIFDKKVVR